MTRILFTIFMLALIFSTGAYAQLKPKSECQDIVLDIYKGWANEIKPNADPEQLKAKIPCFTSFEKEGNESHCGGGIFYADKDFKFYSQRDYYEIGPKFKGKMNVVVLGRKRDALFGIFGNPVLKDKTWDAFQMAYGTMVVFYSAANTVNKVIITTKSTSDLQLCE